MDATVAAAGGPVPNADWRPSDLSPDLSRSGFPDALAASRVPVVAWVSCDPVTFARDARRMVEGGYRLDRIEVVDQFRWSPHVETVAAFQRPRTQN